MSLHYLEWEREGTPLLLTWTHTRTAAFKEAAPQAVIAEFDSPNHHIFIDLEDETVAAIRQILDW